MSQVEKTDQKTVTMHNFYTCSEHDDVLYMGNFSSLI